MRKLKRNHCRGGFTIPPEAGDKDWHVQQLLGGGSSGFLPVLTPNAPRVSPDVFPPPSTPPPDSSVKSSTLPLEQHSRQPEFLRLHLQHPDLDHRHYRHLLNILLMPTVAHMARASFIKKRSQVTLLFCLKPHLPPPTSTPPTSLRGRACAAFCLQLPPP